jgi:hypothetical protein
MNLSQLAKQPHQSFAGVILAFSLFGFLFSHHTESTDGRYNMKLMKPAEAQNDDDDSWYRAPRSPGFNELNH